MKKQIELHKRKLEYSLKVSNRAKRMRIAVYCDGALVVTVPRKTSDTIVEKFIVQKSKWILDKVTYFKSFRKSLLIKDSETGFIKYKKAAESLATERIKKFNAIYKVKFNKINIKNQKTKWGSCSKKGNLNFNYKIALLPPEFADYIIVHEMCHLKEFNHSQKFWNLVAQALPDYLELRKQIKIIS